MEKPIRTVSFEFLWRNRTEQWFAVGLSGGLLKVYRQETFELMGMLDIKPTRMD